jgi:8-oxo-dGTP diphosphatase
MPRHEQGVMKDRYQIIPRCLVFLFDGERVLLIKGAPTKRLWANKFNGIGGHIERGEDALTAARRELAEETGLSAHRLWLCGTVMIDTGQDIGIGLYVFKGEDPQGTLESSREGELFWEDAKDVNSLPIVEDLRVLVPLVIKMKPGDLVFSARYWYDKSDELQIEVNG